MSIEEIKEIRHDREAWDTIKLGRAQILGESERKHQAWLDAGKPLNKEGAAMLDTGAATPGQRHPPIHPQGGW